MLAPVSQAMDSRPGALHKQGGRGGRLLLMLLLTLPAAGCALAEVTLQPQPLPDIVTPTTVFVADGAGNFQIASRLLRAVCKVDGYPIQVETFEWSHGYGRILADHLRYGHAQAEGRKLAATVLDYHARHPERCVYLLGHSAGSAVVTAALENLPPGVVDRAILLSPSLSAHYDLRPSLQAVTRGLYVFYSPQDRWYLGLITGTLGTTDRTWTAASGRVGFRGPGESDLCCKLIQRRWQPTDCQLGNFGGHYGSREPPFLRMFIVPLLQPR